MQEIEIYKNLSSAENEEFKNLLNKEFSKSKIEENSIVESTITKVSKKFIYVEIKGLKAEAILDLNEVKSFKKENIAVGTKLGRPCGRVGCRASDGGCQPKRVPPRCRATAGSV